MLHKFYVVVDDPTFKEEIHQELAAETGHETVPERAVDILNSMPHSEYNSAVMLTQEEADALISDLRIKDVHRDPYELGVRKVPYGSRSGTYSKSATAASSDKNWGLLRSNSSTNVFGVSNSLTSPFTFNLDGAGVDFVIMDTGIEPNHPEFAVNADGTGGSRVVNYNWTQHNIIGNIPVGGFLGDCDGHGSNCASIAAGNTCGWASKAAIYSLRNVGSGSGGFEYDITDGRQLELLDDFQVWQTLREFHIAKPIDPTTGYKRPTIVNCSFGFNINYSRVTNINYRGSATGATTTTVAYGTIGVPEGGSGVHGYRYTALETEIISAMNVGVIVVTAAGNDRHKIDIPGGLDYNNYWNEYTGYTYYYHRGATPSAVTGVISVGCIAAAADTNINPEHKRNFSCTGPRVDIWAPGDYIMGAYANASYAGPAVADTRSSAVGTGYTYYLNKISGTSQASPQVAGILACLLQARPWMTQAQCRSWVTATASTWLVNENYYGGSGYGNFGSLQGGAAKALFQPFNLPTPLTIRG